MGGPVFLLQCSWGSKPTPPGTSSLPLPPPPPPVPSFQTLSAAGINHGYSAADLLAYQRQITMAQGGSGRALLPLPQGMPVGVGQAAPLGGAGSRGIYDSFQPGAGLTSGALNQPHIFY